MVIESKRERSCKLFYCNKYCNLLEVACSVVAGLSSLEDRTQHTVIGLFPTDRGIISATTLAKQLKLCHQLLLFCGSHVVSLLITQLGEGEGEGLHLIAVGEVERRVH